MGILYDSESASGEADFIYEEEQEVGNIFTTYLQEASSNFIDAGKDTKFKLTLRRK